MKEIVTKPITTNEKDVCMLELNVVNELDPRLFEDGAEVVVVSSSPNVTTVTSKNIVDESGECIIQTIYHSNDVNYSSFKPATQLVLKGNIATGTSNAKTVKTVGNGKTMRCTPDMKHLVKF